MTFTEHIKSRILEALADAILVEDAAGAIRYANPRAEALFGYAPGELPGLPFAGLVAEDSRERLQRHRSLCLQRRGGEPITLAARTRDGAEITIEIRCGLLEGETGPLLISSVRPTEQAADADKTAVLPAERDRAQRYLDIAAVMLVAIDADCRVSLINRKGLEILGYVREEEVLGRDWFTDFLPPGRRDEVVAVFNQLIRGEVEPVEYYENPILRRDGTERLIAWHNSTLRDADGRITGILSSGQDITESKRAEERLHGQLRLNQAITECAAESIFLTDAAGRITRVNPEAQRVFGYTQDEFMGRVLHDLLHYRHPDGRAYPFEDCPNCRIYAVGENVHHHEAVFFHRDGSPVSVVCSNAPLEIEKQMNGAVLVAHDITERKAFEVALQEADRRKDEFLAMLAHELRNPLAPILNAAQILSLVEQDATRIRWAQEIIQRQVGHLTRLVDELLDVSRIARGKIRLKRETLELAVIIEQAVEAVRPLIEAKGQRLLQQLPPQPVCLEGDLVRLVQVMLNVLDNAAKYSPEGSRIELEVRVEGKEVVIRVRDQGEGIAPELLPHVFDLFQQGERSLDRSQGGLGLGLTLVQRLVELHGGRVTADSAGRGEGSTLSVRLPLCEARAEPPPHAPAPGLPGKPLQVLVVDDEVDVADSTALIIETMGHRAQTAYSGAEALARVLESAPRVVLLDIGLRGMDGYQTAQALRRLPGGEALCLVALTGYGDQQTRTRSRSAGFDEYLVKPVSYRQLAELLSAVMQTSTAS